MRFRVIFLAGAAALAVCACGKNGAGAASGPAAQVSAASPLATPYKVEGGEKVDVDALLALLGDGKATYGAATFDEKLGATVVTDLRFEQRHTLTEDGEEVVIEGDAVTVERAELYGVDMEAIDRVKAGAAAIDAPFERIFDKVRLFGVQPGSENDGGATIGAVEFDEFRLRHGGFPEGEDDDAAHFFNSFELGGLYFQDFAATAPEDDSGAISFAAPDLRFVGIGGGKLSAMIAKDFEYSMARSPGDSLAEGMGEAAGALLSGPLKGLLAPDNQRMTVKSVEWRSVDFSGLMGYRLKDEKAPLAAKNLISLGTLKALDMTTFVGGKRAASAAEATISATEFTGVIPSKIRSETKGAAYDFTAYAPASETETIAILKKHGLDNVKGSGTLDWDWDSTKGAAAFKTDADMKGLADFEMSLDFAGLEIGKIAALKEAGERDAVMKVGSFKGFHLRLADEKLLDAIFDISALQMGGTGADLRQSAPAMVRLAGAASGAGSERIGKIVDAVADFLGQGGAIEFSAKPKAPVPLQSIVATGNTAPETVPDLIELEVTHTKP